MLDGNGIKRDPGGAGSRPFDGVRFVLLGFDIETESEVRLKLISGGGEEIARYSPDCSHLIVGECVYDDPTCVAARSNGKIVVTSLWVDHTYDIGMPVDHTNVMYRPPKDLNGIPGAKDLVMCLTGYQRQDREDITIMVSLMGAQFSKPLVASRATHLICYKFEGEKYELAKKIPKIKIVNHMWLEDCLNSWELLPEDNYAKSGFELEMEVEAKDSEEEENTEGSITKQFKGRINVPYGTRIQTGSASKLPATQAMSKISFAPAAMNGVSGTEGSKLLPGDNEATVAPAECVNNINLLIGSSSIDVLKHEPGNQSPEFRDVKKGTEPRFPGIVEKSDDLVSSPWKEKKTVLGDPSCSFGSAKRFPDSGMKSSNTLTLASKTSRRFSLQMDLSGETRYSDEQLDKWQASDALASVSKSEQRKKSDDTKVSSPSKEVLDNVLPSKRKQDITLDSVKAPKNSRVSAHNASRSPVVCNVNIDVTPPDGGFVAIKRHLPGGNGNTPEAHDLLKSESINSKNVLTDDVTQLTEMTTGIQKGTSCTYVSASGKLMLGRSINASEETIVQRQKNDIVTSAAGLIADISEDPHNAMLATGDDHKIKSKSIKNAVSGNNSGSGLNFEAGSPSSVTKIAEDQKNMNPPSSESGIQKLKPGRRKGLGKKISGSNLKPEVPSHSAEFGKFKEPDQLIEGSNTPNSKSPGSKINEDKNVGNRLKLIAKAMSKSKEPDMLVEESKKPISKPPDKKINGDKSVGTRLKSIAKAMSMKCSLTVSQDSSLEASNGEENGYTHDAFHNVSSTKNMSSANDALELKRVDSSKFIKDFEEACEPRDNEAEAPERGDEFGAHATEGLIEDREILGAVQQRGDNSHENTDQALSFHKVIDNYVDGKEKCSLENELDQGALKRDVKRGKTKKGSKGYGKSVKNAKTAASIKKRGQNSSDGVAAGNEDQPKNGTTGESTLRPPNNNAQKHTVNGNTLKNVLESEKKDRPLSDDAEDGNMDERILRPPNKNVQKHRADAKKLKNLPETEKENRPLPDDAENTSFTKEHVVNTIIRSENTSVSGKRKSSAIKSYSTDKIAGQKLVKDELKFFLLCGHRLQRQELKKIVRQLKGRLCRDCHHWSYQATHFVVPEAPRRTEKFFAAAASGRWILKSDYLTDSLKAGKFLEEEPYEWHSNDAAEMDRVDLVAPRKWRLLKERTGHGAFHRMQIIVYGEFFSPPLDTLKRVVKAGDGLILATAPPYTRFLDSGVDFAVISPGIPKADAWLQEFLNHEIPCVLIDYLVEFVCKPGSPLKKHVLFETESWAEKSFVNLVRRSEEIVEDDSTTTEEDDLKCCVCGSGDRGEQMLICGDEKGSVGCGIGTHMDCCDPPLTEIPEDDWFCPKCSSTKNTGLKKPKSGKLNKKAEVKSR